MRNTTRNLLFVASLLPLLACTPQETEQAALPAEESADRIDLIIDGQSVVTMDPAGTIIENGAIAIDDGVILAVGTAAEIHSE